MSATSMSASWGSPSMDNAKPGCYSIPSVFSAKSQRCGQCEFKQPCREGAYRVLVRFDDPELSFALAALAELTKDEDIKLRKSVPINPLSIMRTQPKDRWEPKPQQQEVISRVPKNVGRFIYALLKDDAEPQIARSLALRKNPFSEFGQRCAHVAMSVFLSCEAVSKRSLRMAFVTSLGWSEPSASAQSSVVWRAFVELGICVETGNFATINPQINSNTTRLLYH